MSPVQTSLFFGLIFFMIVSFILSILTLIAGQDATALKNLAFATFDTSSVTATLENSLGSSIPSPIPDWFEPHFLSVCHGLWASPGSQVKNAASTVCEARAPGYTFSLASELASFAPSTAASFFAALPDDYGTLATAAGLGLIATAIALMVISVVAFISGMMRMKKDMKPFSLVWLRIAFFAGEFSAIILTNGGSQITAPLSKAADSVTADVPLTVTAWAGRGFLALIWVAVAMDWVSIVLAITYVIIMRKGLKNSSCRNRSCNRSAPVPEILEAESVGSESVRSQSVKSKEKWEEV